MQRKNVEATEKLKSLLNNLRPSQSALTGFKASVVSLAEAGADLTAQDRRGNSVMHTMACQSDTKGTEVLAELLKIDRELANTLSVDKKTPLESMMNDSYFKREHQKVFYNNVMLLAQHGADLTVQDRHGNTILHVLACQGDAESVRMLTALLGINKELANTLSVDKKTPLESMMNDSYFKREHQKVFYNNVMLLAQHGADLTVQDRHGNTILHVLACQGDAESVRMLTALLGINKELANTLSVDKKTPLQSMMNASYFTRDHQKVFYNNVMLLAEHGADLTVQDRHDNTILHVLACQGDAESVRMLTALLGINKELANTLSVDKKTPLQSMMNASYFTRDHQKVFYNNVKLLAEHGADLTVQDRHGYTILHTMACQSNAESAAMLTTLLEINKDLVNTLSQNNKTPLQSMLSQKFSIEKSQQMSQVANAMLLVQYGADIDVVDGLGNTLVHTLILINENDSHTHTIEKLIEGRREYFLNKKNDQGRTPLHDLIESKYNLTVPELIKYLDLGSDVNCQDGRGNTLLHTACRGNLEITKYLVEKQGLDILAKSTSGLTMFHYAAASKNPELWSWLLEKGVDLNAPSNGGMTPLHYAVWHRNELLVAWLLKHDANANAINKNGETALMIATSSGIKGIIDLLSHHVVAKMMDIEEIKIERVKREKEISYTVVVTSPAPKIVILDSDDEDEEEVEIPSEEVLESPRKDTTNEIPNGLLNAIHQLYEYGNYLLDHEDSSKGQIAMDLADELKQKTINYQNKKDTATDYPTFTKEFTTLLNSKNKEMSEYRAAGGVGTIILNILIALTGVGLFAIAGKLLYSKYHNNRALFFCQKDTTTCEDKIQTVNQKLVLGSS